MAPHAANRDDLERTLDGPAWIAAETYRRARGRTGRRLLGWRRRARTAWQLRGGAAPPGSRHPLVRELAAIDARARRTGSQDTAPWRTARLAVALRAGAYRMAAELAEQVIGDVASGAATAADALPPVLELLIAVGERDRAGALAAAHRDALSRSPGGQGLLDLLGADELRPSRGSAVDPFALDQLIEAGRIDGDAVARLFLDHRSEWLGNPQLHLLLHNARRRADPTAAAAALRRFLRACGLPSGTIAAGTGNLLGRVRFTPPPSRSDGPLVSVVIPAHDATSTVAYAVDSMLAQSHRNLEILIGDDASSDGTVDLLVDRYRGDRRVRLFASAHNQGAYNLRNALAYRARGEILAFHDADDLAVPTRIAGQLRALRRGAAASYGCLLRVSLDGRFFFFHDQSAVRLGINTLVLPRDTFLAMGGFRGARFGADLELYDRLRDRHGDAGVPVIRTPLVLGLWSPASMTRRAGAEIHEDGFRSPARRAYADLVFTGLLGGLVDDGAIERMLRETGNLVAAADVIEIAAGEKRPQRG